MELKQKKFSTKIGEITWITLINNKGAEVVVSSLGAGVVAIKLPNADGTLTDVVIGYDDPLSYLDDGPCAGKTPGRYANRIAKGHFSLDGKEFTLPINNGPNHLHGGPNGYQNRIWDVAITADNKVVFSLESADGDAGYPGNLKASVTYEWNDQNSLTISYNATTDAPTVINLTNHTYFNLDGHGSGTVLNHILKLNCSKWLPGDDTLIPSGEIADVANTPMDFTTEHTLGERIHEEFDALKFGKGYDHCWLVDNYDGTLREVGTLRSAKSGRKVIISTTQPGAQVYAGCWLDGCPTGKDGAIYHDYDAVAIECQGCPDAPNHPNFPSQRLNPGETYSRVINFTFA